MNPAFSFQVTSKGVIINLNSDYRYSTIKEALSRHVDEASEFFAGVDIYINTYGCTFEYSQLKEIMNIVSKYEKVKKIYFMNKEKVKQNKVTYNKDSILIKGTIRSGQRIKYPTNVIIIGDINPGAEIIAAGDIIVLGKLRGVVHAGARGSTDAQIIAFRFQPTQLRIASIISRPPEEENTYNSFQPERAYIKDNAIMVENFSF